MKVESYDRDIEGLLNLGYFKIPRFQRPYSWEKGEVEDFWNDTIVDTDADYFIGSIVLFTYADGLYGIVDGQQRLTTVTMILAALRNTLQDEGFGDLAKGLHRLIERPDINNKNQFVLQTETSYPFLQEHIQSHEPSTESPVDPGDEQARLKLAFGFIKSNLAALTSGVKSNPTLTADKKTEQVQKDLLRIRDRILKLKIIYIVLETEEDAYTIFETLNTRGKDLTVSDLVRTHITRLLPQSNRNMDRPKERFNAISEMFESSAAEISTNSFLHHYWLSRYDFTTEKNLYKSIKKEIRDKAKAKAFLESLEANGDLYRIIYEPDGKRWPIERRDLRDALRALALFKVRQQIPFVLSVLSEYQQKALTLKQAVRALRAVENFHFLFTAVTSQRSSGGISFMYALHARDLRKARTSTEKNQVITDLITKLRSRVPTYQEFEVDFRTLLCSEKFTKRKALVQYTLRRITQAFSKDVSIEWDGMTLEHLACQSAADGKTFTDDQVAEIGNLVLVSAELNAKLGKKTVPEKIRILRASKVWVDDFLLAQKHWTPAEVRARTDHLAKVAFEQVWRI